MAYRDGKEALSSSEEKTSSSSSDGSSSTPTTPPSPQVFPIQPAPPRTPEQQVIRDPPQNGRFSATGVRKSPKASTPKSKLGAIDENSDAVSPDIPLRNPLRRLGQSMKFAIPAIPTLHATRRPKNIYDDIEGPRGEKFSDVRKNSKTKQSRKCGWRALVCLACLLLIIAAAVAIGVIVGLRVKQNKQRNQDVTPNSTDSGLNAGFPAGQYSITTYLNDVDAACTSNSATWRCYPYQTYNQSASASVSTLNWIITTQNNVSYTITSSDRTFSYPFQNVPLRRVDNGTDNERWTFTYPYTKTVFPSASITDDGTTARCYFNNTVLTGNLYTRKAKGQGLQNRTNSASSTVQPWPYAIDFTETETNGAGVPDCYKYINGENGAHVNLPLTGALLQNANCQCQYTDHFPIS